MGVRRVIRSALGQVLAGRPHAPARPGDQAQWPRSTPSAAMPEGACARPGAHAVERGPRTESTHRLCPGAALGASLAKFWPIPVECAQIWSNPGLQCSSWASMCPMSSKVGTCFRQVIDFDQGWPGLVGGDKFGRDLDQSRPGFNPERIELQHDWGDIGEEQPSSINQGQCRHVQRATRRRWNDKYSGTVVYKRSVGMCHLSGLQTDPPKLPQRCLDIVSR